MSNETGSGECPMAKLNTVTDQLLGYIKDKLKKMYPHQRPLRTFHTKTIGLVKAQLEVLPDLEDFLKVGLFKQPKTYEAWIRYSNSQSTLSADGKKAARGMAIKVLDVQGTGYLDEDPEGKTQDIILFTGRTYFPGRGQLQLNAVKVVLGTLLERITGFLKVICATRRGLRTFLKSQVISANVLEELYYSATPYAFGKNKRVKWHARPFKTVTSLVPDAPAENFLRERLIQDLAEDAPEAIAFGLYVQFGENDKTEPVDDTAIRWETPFHQVATISIPRQNPDTPQRREKDLTMTFSPGHGIIEHAPLGSVNEVRRAIYRQLAAERLQYPATTTTNQVVVS